MKQKRVVLMVLVLLLGLLVAACGGGTETAQPTEVAATAETAVEEPAPTEEMAEPTEEPAPEPTEEPAPEPTEEAASGEMVAEECAETYEGETIVIYQAAGLTGPLAQILGDGFINGSNDAVERINANGGVCGVQLELHLEDSQYDPEQELAIYERYRAEDPPPVLHLTYGSGAAIALKDRVIEDQIPHITAGLNDEAFYIPRGGYTFGTGPIYSDQFAGFIGWLQDNWDAVKPAGAGDEIVVGVIGWANAFGAGATTPTALAYAEERGITVLPLESQEISPTADVTGPLQNLLANGANVIYVQSLSFGPAQVIGTLRALDAWDSVVVGGVNWSLNTDVLNILGENAALMDGYFGVMPSYWWNDTDNPGVQMALEDFAASGLPEAKKDVGYLLSYGQMFGVANVLRHAMNTVGFEGLTGQAVFEAMQDMGTIDVGGMATWRAGGEDRAPNMVQIRQVQINDDGVPEFVVVQDFFELPDTRPPAE